MLKELSATYLEHSQTSALSPQWYTGVWYGSIQQVGASPYSALIALVHGNIGSIIGTVAYPEPRCGGELTLLEVTGSSVRLSESITYGTSECVANGIVTLTFVEDGILDYLWSPDLNPWTTTGTLTRISSDDTAVPTEYIGVWKGYGVQQNPSSQWSILIALTNGSHGSIVGTSAYPSLRCGGELC